MGCNAFVVVLAVVVCLQHERCLLVFISIVARGKKKNDLSFKKDDLSFICSYI